VLLCVIVQCLLKGECAVVCVDHSVCAELLMCSCECDCSEVDVTLNQVRCSLRQDVIWLLLSVIDQPSPNLAHFLLGFDVRKPIARTTLQDPGK